MEASVVKMYITILQTIASLTGTVGFIICAWLLVVVCKNQIWTTKSIADIIFLSLAFLLGFALNLVFIRVGTRDYFKKE